MPLRTPILASGEIYHIFNRAVGDEEILVRRRELNRALDLIDYYRFPQKIKYSKFQTLSKDLKANYLSNLKSQRPLVEIFSFSLMPTHYHFLLKQLQEKGIRKLIANFQNSFAKHFNLKNNRHGALFQNAFKAKRVGTDEEFLHLSRYIHLNPVTAFLIDLKELIFYPWTSFYWYFNKKENRFLNVDFVLKMFQSKKKYKEFVFDQADYQRRLSLIRKLVFE